MAVDEQRIQSIVEQVIARLAADPEVAKRLGPGAALAPAVSKAPAADVPLGRRGAFADVGTAVNAARDAYEQLHRTTLEKRAKGIEYMRQTLRDHNVELSRKTVAETTYGRVEDKIAKNRLTADKTPGIEYFRPETWTGDHGLTLQERAPWGVICAITPVTNATETIACNAIGMLAGGNSVVFNPHPGAKRISVELVGLLNDACTRAGLPDNLICVIVEPTIASANELMRHPECRLVVVTGGPGVVKAAMSTGKKVIGAGPGNPPAVVDDTCHLDHAARSIVRGASLDNNIVCIVEKEIIALDSVADELKRQLTANGAYELGARQIAQLEKIVVKDGRTNTRWVGKDAAVILREIGVRAPDETRIVFADVDEQHPFVQEELLMPVLGFVRARDVPEAIAMAKRVEHGFRHTAVMHSTNIERLHAMAVAMDCSIFVKNGPSFGGLGMGAEGYASFTIASPTGEGVTNPYHFTRARRCTLTDAFRIV